jgi:hypothetical protein
VNRAEIVAGLADVRRDKTATDATYDRAVWLAEKIGEFPDVGRDDSYPELAPLLAEAEATVQAHRAHNYIGPRFNTVLVKDPATGEMVTDYEAKKTFKDARGRTIKVAIDSDGHEHRIQVRSREETEADEKAAEAVGAPLTVEGVYRLREQANAQVQSVLDLFKEGRFDDGIKASYELPVEREYELWNLLPLEIRDHLKRLTPPLDREKNLGEWGGFLRAATDTSMTTD